MMQVIVDYYNAFNSGNREKMIELLANDVVHEINQGKAQSGKVVFQKFMQHMDDCYAEQLEDMVIMYDEKMKRAAAEFLVNGTYIKTDGSLPEARGQKYKIKAGAFLQLNSENKISRITTYYNLPEWIEKVR